MGSLVIGQDGPPAIVTGPNLRLGFVSGRPRDGKTLKRLCFQWRELLRPATPWDLVAIVASPPGGLQPNRVLTAEFLESVHLAMAPDGVICVTLPAAPGFTHPEHERYIETVEEALRRSFCSALNAASRSLLLALASTCFFNCW